MISRERRKEYIKAGGSFCINCGGGDISAGRFDSEGREAWQPVQCYDCGSKWNDIFKLIGVDDVVVLPEDDPMIPVVFGNQESSDEHPETEQGTPGAGEFTIIEDAENEAGENGR